MKRFKMIDWVTSVVLIAGFLLASLVRKDGTFIVGYFVVGAWQVVSMIVHATNGWFTTRGGTRYIYHRIMALLIGLMPLLFVFWFLLYLAPLLALWYTAICWQELQFMRKRAFIHLK